MDAKTRLVERACAEADMRWRIGPRVWRVNGEWRLRLHRPWRRERMLEATSESFIIALYMIAAGAGWWRP